jgi:phospholipid/cholesterol/gamma-HCH transport system permease protein
MFRHPMQEKEYGLSPEGGAGDEAVVRLSGRLTLRSLEPFGHESSALLDVLRPSSVSLDLSGMSSIDSAGALAILRFKALAGERGIPFAVSGDGGQAGRLLALVCERTGRATEPLAAPDASGFFEGLGEKILSLIRGVGDELTFQGELLRATARSCFEPGSVRWADVLFYMRRAGVDGFPIVALITFLLGLIITFMSSLQLRQFGANLYVADLVAISIVRELGPIMTAILVAGRSGSAFAAEIGTMQVNEEVDALVTMGFDPMTFLSVPKLLAMLVVTPILTLFADLHGILGGLVVGVAGLDLTARAYLNETHEALTASAILASLVKAEVFAVLIATVGCQRGFRVRGGADAVGAAATSAVVTSIFLIIIADSAFALVLQYLGI